MGEGWKEEGRPQSMLEVTGKAEGQDLAIQGEDQPDGRIRRRRSRGPCDTGPEPLMKKSVKSPNLRRSASVTRAAQCQAKCCVMVVPSTAVRHSPVSEPAVEIKTRNREEGDRRHAVTQVHGAEVEQQAERNVVPSTDRDVAKSRGTTTRHRTPKSTRSRSCGSRNW